MARAPSDTTIVPFIRSLFPMESSYGPKLRAFLFQSAIGCLSSNSIVRGRSLLDLALASPACRTLTEGLPEKPAQMGLIRKSDAQRYVAQRHGTGQHQMAGLLQPPLDHVGMRR